MFLLWAVEFCVFVSVSVVPQIVDKKNLKLLLNICFVLSGKWYHNDSSSSQLVFGPSVFQTASENITNFACYIHRFNTDCVMFALVPPSAHDQAVLFDWMFLSVLFWFSTGDLEAFKKQAFILKEGVEYKIKISFKVRAAGLREERASSPLVYFVTEAGQVWSKCWGSTTSGINLWDFDTKEHPQTGENDLIILGEPWF